MEKQILDLLSGKTEAEKLAILYKALAVVKNDLLVCEKEAYEARGEVPQTLNYKSAGRSRR